MKNKATRSPIVVLIICCSLVFAGCGQASEQTAPEQVPAEQSAAQATAEQTTDDATATKQVVADGTYSIEVETDSSMFRSESCTLTVAKGAYTATLTLPGEGFSRLYFGTAEEAAQAPDEQVFDYHLNDDGKFTFDIPVAALDEELQIAAYGQRRDTWYDHTITFHAPDAS